MSRGPWMQTYTGTKFYPFDPRPEEVHAIDIAVAMSRICRFGGHTRQFYSVAQHSLVVGGIVRTRSVELEPPARERAFLAALLHDAAEAYIGDLIRPLKGVLPRYQEAEGKIVQAIRERFELEESDYLGIDAADLLALATEKRDVLVHPDTPWDIWLPDPMLRQIVPWPADEALELFKEQLSGTFAVLDLDAACC